MTRIKLILLIVVLAGISAICFFISYLPTLTLDLFPWGSSTTDGLYLLIVPLFLIPLILVLSVVKWLLTRRTTLPHYIKYSWTLLIWLGLTVIFPLIADGMWMIIIPSFIIGLVYVREILSIIQWTRKSHTDNSSLSLP
jgi:hypothetical protein